MTRGDGRNAGDVARWPRITVVTPSFNQGRYIEATIQSVLSQGYPNLEYLVLDGGSTDDTVDILRRNASQLAYWESRPDDGQADAIARGFARATGELLAWLCADDLYLPGALFFVARMALEEPDAALLCARTRLDQGAGWEAWMGMGAAEGRPTYERLLAAGQCIQQPGCFWRATAYHACGGVDRSLAFCMDYDLLLKLCAGGRAAYRDREVAWMRSHAASKSSTMHDVRTAERAMIVERALRARPVRGGMPALRRASYLHTLQTIWRSEHEPVSRRLGRGLRVAGGYAYHTLRGDASRWHPVHGYASR